MLAVLDVVVFLRINESLDRVAERVFRVLNAPYQPAESDEAGGEGYEASGLGFRAMLFPNVGDMLDPEFEHYAFGLEITSTFWCVELDTVDLEGPLSEYYARQLAFELDVETATELLLETTEEGETFEIRAYRRNPQYRLDQSPTIPKVFVIETRQVEEPFEDDEWEEGDDEEAEEVEMVEDLEKEDH